MNMTRKDFLKTAGACALGAVGTAAGASAPAAGTETGRAKVYFSPVIDSDHLNKLYDLIKESRPTRSITATATPPRITSRPLKSTAGPSARLTSWTLRER